MFMCMYMLCIYQRVNVFAVDFMIVLMYFHIRIMIIIVHIVVVVGFFLFFNKKNFVLTLRYVFVFEVGSLKELERLAKFLLEKIK